MSKKHLDLKEMAPPSQLLARELTSKNNNLRKFHQNFNSIRTLDFLYINFKTWWAASLLNCMRCCWLFEKSQQIISLDLPAKAATIITVCDFINFVIIFQTLKLRLDIYFQISVRTRIRSQNSDTLWVKFDTSIPTQIRQL